MQLRYLANSTILSNAGRPGALRYIQHCLCWHRGGAAQALPGWHCWQCQSWSIGKLCCTMCKVRLHPQGHQFPAWIMPILRLPDIREKWLDRPLSHLEKLLWEWCCPGLVGSAAFPACKEIISQKHLQFLTGRFIGRSEVTHSQASFGLASHTPQDVNPFKNTLSGATDHSEMAPLQ